VKIWDMKGETKVLSDFAEEIMYCTFTSDGKHLFVASESELAIYDGETFEILVKYGNPIYYFTKQSIVFSPDEKDFAFVISKNRIAIWNRTTLTERQIITKGHSAVINALAFSPDGKQLASCSKDKTVKVWNVANGKLVGAFTDHQSEVIICAFHPTLGKVFSLEVTKNSELNGIYWDVKTFKSSGSWVTAPQEIQIRPSRSCSLEFVSDDVVLLNAGLKALLNVATGQIIFSGYTPETLYNYKINQRGVYTGKNGKYCPFWSTEELLILNTEDFTFSSLSLRLGVEYSAQLFASQDFQYAIVMKLENSRTRKFALLKLNHF